MDVSANSEPGSNSPAGLCKPFEDARERSFGAHPGWDGFPATWICCSLTIRGGREARPGLR